MHLLRITLAGVTILGFLVVSIAGAVQQISVTDQEAEWIGDKIFHNECGGKDKNLITWNDGEDFISLGIGHFIWYPEAKIGPFDESFPGLLKFIKENGKELPGWLQGSEAPRCPWSCKEEFLRDLQGERASELRRFLTETKGLQLLFIVGRLKNALPKILKAASEEARPRVERQFYRLAATPAGTYALIDYVNFSGEGVLATERYNEQGWGLLQVLERMQESGDNMQAVQEFAEAAKEILTERVNNSPPQRNEKKWLPGWENRLDTYTLNF